MVTEQEKLVMTVEQAGSLLGISRATAYALAKNGTLPVLRLGRRCVIPKIALEKMLSEAKPTAA